MSALAAMRADLRPHHDRIEQTLDLMSDGVDRQRYVRFIERSFGFITACERLLDVPRAPAALRVAERVKTPLLRANLIALGHTPESIERLPLCERLPNVWDWPNALGYLYVLEGSTLGGQVLSRRLRGTLELDDDALAFLMAYGGQTGTMWKQMLAVLESAMTDAAAARAITSSARDTFTLLARWHE